MDPLNVTIVAVLFALAAFISWADKRDLAATLLQRARVRFGRRAPVGSYRIEGEIGISFGQQETLILTLPLRVADEPRPRRYVCATDSSTTFRVDHQHADVDALLKAYDDSLGPLEIQVSGPGRIAEIGIAGAAHT